MNAVNALHHLALHAADLDAATEFYVRGLGFAVAAAFDEEGRRVVMLRGRDGAMLELFAPDTEPAERDDAGAETSGPSPLMHLAIGCDDVDAAVARAVEHGGRVTTEPTEMDLNGGVGRVRYGFVRGPSGESIEIIEDAAFRDVRDV